MKALGGCAAVLVILAALLVCLALREPEIAPATGLCPKCVVAIADVRYGRLLAGYTVEDSIWADGKRFGVARDERGRRFLVGGRMISDAETGHVCLSCRRTWVIDWGKRGPFPEISFFRRLRGGLMRLL